MSHSLTLVIGTDMEAELAPFDENLSVPEYDDSCWCCGIAVREAAAAHAVKVTGKDIDGYRDAYAALKKDLKEHSGLSAPLKDAKLPAWKDWIAPYLKAEQDYLDEHKAELELPDPACETCKGTGKTKSTYNPKSRWDWFQVGGRWQGALLLKKEVSNERRIELMAMGQQTLMAKDDIRDWDGLGVNHARLDEVDWQGMNEEQVNIHTKEWDKMMKEVEGGKDRDDVAFVYYIDPEMTKEQYLREHSLWAPFAVLLNGEWMERGKMGWWGMVNDEKDPIDWRKQFNQLIKELLENGKGSLKVWAVDVHI